MLVDVAINYYGKPYHTMVTLASLLEHSAPHIGKIYLIKEAQQPEGAHLIDDLIAATDWDVEVFTPRYYLGWQRSRTPSILLRRLLVGPRDRDFRLSYRYQYALETSERRYVFLTHNDVLFQADAISPMLALIQREGHAGVGDIGACWKCPAHAASLCTDNRPQQLRLSHEEAVRLYEQYPSEHRNPNASRLDQTNPIPFPECRLNEWFALIDTAAYRRETKPWGSTEPLGSYELGDVGIAWFRSMMHKGYSFGHYNQGYRHPWTPERGGGGHEALFDDVLYETEERAAQQYYETHYGTP